MPHKFIAKVCPSCNQPFQALASEVKRGYGTFCSRDCRYVSQRGGSFEENFWPKVNKDGPIPAHRPELGQCWVWTASTTGRIGSEYGWLKRPGGHGVRAHRASWEIHFGPVPDGVFVLHSCDNRLCVRPGHLFLGSQVDNMRDMAAKGRQIFQVHPEQGPHGERARTAKLTERDVLEIRHSCVVGGRTYSELAQRFQVTNSTIGQIVRRHTWKHIP